MNLIARATNGDAAAWEALFAQVFEPIYRFVFFRVGGDVHDTEDIVQETLQAMTDSLEQYQPVRGDFLSWCIGIARQKLAAHYRKAKKNQQRIRGDSTSVLGELSDPQASPDAVASRQEQLLAIGKVFSELPSNYQQVLTLKYVHNLSFSAAAESLGLTIAATKSLAIRAKEKLRSALKADGVAREIL